MEIIDLLVWFYMFQMRSELEGKGDILEGKGDILEGKGDILEGKSDIPKRTVFR